VASYSDITSVVTSTGTLTLNAASGAQRWFVDPTQSSGLDDVQLRKPQDFRGQTDGLLLHDAFEEGMHIVLAGLLLCETEADKAAMIATTKSVLRGAKTSAGSLNFGSAGSVSVEWELGVSFPHIAGDLRGFRFGLVVATAT
jgi:hypothetical protein